MLKRMLIKTVPHKLGVRLGGSNNTPITTTSHAKLHNIRAKLISRIKSRVPPTIKRTNIVIP